MTPVRDRYCLFDTAIGWCGLAWSGDGVTRMQLPEADRDVTEQRLRADAQCLPADGSLPPVMARVIDDIQLYLHGANVEFASVVLDLASVNVTHRRIYHTARSVGWGHTATYGELARRAGMEGAARVVGQAMSRNPVAIIIPCHRILASGNRLGGFSAFGGASVKQRLLSLEGARCGDDVPRLPGL